MFKKILKKERQLTPQFADKLLKLNTFEGQRKLKPWWISDLANIIRRDLWTNGHIAVVHHSDNGTPSQYLLNGQHQCNAVKTANKAVDVTYEEYDCGSDMEAVSLLYRQFDNHRPRSLLDLTVMEMQSLELKWDHKIGSLVVSAAALKQGLYYADKNEKVELLRQYIDHGNFIEQIITDVEDGSWRKESKHLMRSPVILAMMDTWEKNKEDAEEFWGDVRDANLIAKHTPQHKLRDFLKESNFDRGRGASGNNKRTVSQHEMTSRCITAWNAFRSGDPTRLTYFASKPIPKVR
jgi:hypothetical protein